MPEKLAFMLVLYILVADTFSEVVAEACNHFLVFQTLLCVLLISFYSFYTEMCSFITVSCMMDVLGLLVRHFVDTAPKACVRARTSF